MIFLVTDIEFDFTDDCGSISEEHKKEIYDDVLGEWEACLLYTSPSPRD